MLCVIAIIDPAASARLAKLEQIAGRFGVPPQGVHGHITLATYTGDEEAAFLASCKAVLAGCGKFSVRYEDIQLWTAASGARSVLVAAPRKEGGIAAVQKAVARGWSEQLNEWTREDVWTPHTTLLYVPGADLDRIAGAMREEFEPFFARIDRIEFSRVYENGYEIVDFIELQ